MVYANPERNFSIGISAYHLYKPSTNRFSHVNGKQPLSLGPIFDTNPLPCLWVARGFPGGRPHGMAADTRIKHPLRRRIYFSRIKSFCRKLGSNDKKPVLLTFKMYYDLWIQFDTAAARRLKRNLCRATRQ